MFKSYFKTALRLFARNKITTIINVLGLSIGISAALVIFMVIQYDFSFDKYEPGRQNIYRIVTEGDGWENSGVPVPLHQNTQSVSGIQHITEILQYNDNNSKVSIPKGNNTPPVVFKKQEGIVFADDNYFAMFPHEWIAGSENTALKNPNKVVLTESYASRYFPNVSAEKLIGKTVAFNDTVLTTVTGIVKDLKVNSDFEYKIFISLPTIAATNLKQNYSWDEWGS